MGRIGSRPVEVCSVEEDRIQDRSVVSRKGDRVMEKQKRATGAGIFFFVLVGIHMILEVVITILSNFVDFDSLPGWASIVISQSMIIVPIIGYFIVTKQNVFETIRFRKMHIGSIFLVIPLTYCMYPVLICINAISMAFSTNVIASTMTDITGSFPFLLGISLLALLPALVEETTFRGILLNGFHRDSNPWPGILFSALCFGAMHLNFNQFSYAFVLGILMGITLEAGGSILATMLIHFLYNGTSTTLMYLLPKIMSWGTSTLEASGEFSSEQVDQLLDIGNSVNSVSPGQMLLTAGIMLPFAAVGLVLAWLILYAIAKLNHRELIFKGMFTKKTEAQKEAMRADKVKIMTVYMWIALAICLVYCIIVEVLNRMA